MEERGGGEKTHQEPFAHKMMVKIRMLGLEKKNTFGARLADGCDMAGTGERRKKQRGSPGLCLEEMEGVEGAIY